MKTTKNTITYNAKMSVTTEEVDFALYSDILGSENVDEAYEEDGINSISTEYYESIPIKIKVLREILDKLEKDGSNYVSIDYNCDHPDYTLYGVDVHVSTEEELNVEIEKEKDKELKTAEIYLKNLDKKREELLANINVLKNNDKNS